MCKFYKYYKELKKSKESPLQTAFHFSWKKNEIVLASCQRRTGHKPKIDGKENKCIFIFLAAVPRGAALLSEPRNEQHHFGRLSSAYGVLFAARTNMPELTDKNVFTDPFYNRRIAFCMACGILWITSTIFTAFLGRSATRQPKNMYLFKTQSKRKKNFDPDFLPSGFGVTSVFGENFSVKKRP